MYSHIFCNKACSSENFKTITVLRAENNESKSDLQIIFYVAVFLSSVISKSNLIELLVNHLFSLNLLDGIC